MKPWPYPRVLAHRGGGVLAPENTIAAIRVGLESGFRAIEFDVMLSADGEPMLIHDETLERTTSGRGPVAARSAAELETLDAGSWFSSRFAGERIPRLGQVVAFCRLHGIWMNAEIKPSQGADAMTGRTVAAAVERLLAVPPDSSAAAGDRAPLPAPMPLALLLSFS
jgi:glycerophosphoryl diester phosphodiesterase